MRNPLLPQVHVTKGNQNAGGWGGDARHQALRVALPLHLHQPALGLDVGAGAEQWPHAACGKKSSAAVAAARELILALSCLSALMLMQMCSALAWCCGSWPAGACTGLGRACGR